MLQHKDIIQHACMQTIRAAVQTWLFMLLVLMMTPAMADEVRVAVSSNFSAPMKEIAESFRQDTGHTVRVSSGSSGKLYAQIRNGAPFDVLLAADDVIPQRLEQEGLAVADSGFVYAIGQLVLWSKSAGFIDEMGEVLRQERYQRLAIAEPKIAPYGMAAKIALEKMGLWNLLQGKLVKGESISQTWQFAATGNVELAFVALSQIMRGKKVNEGSWWLVPQHLYEPIKQGAVLLATAKDNEAALSFLTYMQGKSARDVMRGYGYELPTYFQ